MNTPHLTRRRLSRPGRGVHRTTRRAQRTRRRARLSRHDQRRLGALLVLLAVLGFWWETRHAPAWLHTPAAWLYLGGMVLATGGLLALRWWGHTLRDQRGQARDLRLADIAAVDPLAFEVLVGRLFEQEGYTVTVTKASGDNGIDLWLRKAGKPPIPVQCKRYRADKVGSPDLQAFSGALRYADAAAGIFVTTSCFTPAAIAWAKQERIRLIDGPALAEWQLRLDPHAAPERRTGEPGQYA